MKTENFNKTNLSANILANWQEVEAFLGKEIKHVVTMKAGFEGKNYWQTEVFNRLSDKYLRPFTMTNIVTVDFTNERIIVKGKNKWQRTFTTKIFGIEKIGYKLETTHISEGWLYGNPIEIKPS